MHATTVKGPFLLSSAPPLLYSHGNLQPVFRMPSHPFTPPPALVSINYDIVRNTLPLPNPNVSFLWIHLEAGWVFWTSTSLDVGGVNGYSYTQVHG